MSNNEAKINPLEDEVNNFFAEMDSRVHNGTLAGDFMLAISDAVAAFITVKFSSGGRIDVTKAFCKSLIENVTLLTEHEI